MVNPDQTAAVVIGSIKSNGNQRCQLTKLTHIRIYFRLLPTADLNHKIGQYT